jgi:hypothetical protein
VYNYLVGVLEDKFGKDIFGHRRTWLELRDKLDQEVVLHKTIATVDMVRKTLEAIKGGDKRKTRLEDPSLGLEGQVAVCQGLGSTNRSRDCGETHTKEVVELG